MRASVVVALLLLSGCYTSVPDSLQRLSSKSPYVRRDAADSIRHAGSPPETVRPLLDAARKESDAKALGAELLALGVSGSLDAEPIICADLKSSDPAVKRWASKAFLFWFPQNPGRACGVAPTSQIPATSAVATTATTATTMLTASATMDAGAVDAGL